MWPHYSRQDFQRCLLSLAGHEYPVEYRWLRAHGFRGLTPWHCLDDNDVACRWRAEFLREVQGGSIPLADLLPFAHAQHMDDVAGFVLGDRGITSQVAVVHLTWRGAAERPGWPSYTLYPTVWDWLQMVLDESRKWCSAEELADLVTSILE